MYPQQQGQRYEFTAEAEQFLSYLFLQKFQERVDKLLDAIGEYLSKYQKLHSSFLSSEERILKEHLVSYIKANLAPVVYMLESINTHLKSNEAAMHIEELKKIHNRIIQADDIDLKTLDDTNMHLSTVVSQLFLRPILTKIPAKRERMFGPAEVE